MARTERIQEDHAAARREKEAGPCAGTQKGLGDSAHHEHSKRETTNGRKTGGAGSAALQPCRDGNGSGHGQRDEPRQGRARLDDEEESRGAKRNGEKRDRPRASNGCLSYEVSGRTPEHDSAHENSRGDQSGVKTEPSDGRRIDQEGRGQ